MKPLMLLLTVTWFSTSLTLADSDLPNRYYLPEVDAHTMVGLVNPTDGVADVDVFAFAANGVSLGRSEVVTSLSGLNRARLSVAALFPTQAEDVAWIQVGGSLPLDVFAELREAGARSAYWANSGLTNAAVIPHVAKDTITFQTVLSSINGLANPMMTSLRPKPSGGTALVTEHDLAFGKARRDVLDYWADLSGVGWVAIDHDQYGGASMETFRTIDGHHRAAALRLDANRGNTLRFLHIATNTGLFWTGMVYLNPAAEPADVTETYFDASGNVLATREVTLPPDEKMTLLFDATHQDPVPVGAAWLEVTADRELVGYALFGSAAGSVDDTFAGLQCNLTCGRTLDYSHFQASNEAWIGYVAVNVGDAVADLTFSLMDAAGTMLAERVVAGVAPNQKITRIGEELFPNQPGGARVRATSSHACWAGFMLWGDHNGPSRQTLSGIHAIARGTSDPGPSARVFVPEQEPNDATAESQMLSAENGVWDINVVGSLEQSDEGGHVNAYGDGRDDMEDVFSFSLSEPTRLLIATTAANAEADIDLFVMSGAVEEGDWFAVNSAFQSQIDYAASNLGYESLVKTFQPGSYTILVSVFEGSSVQQTAYGLLITQIPLLMETFDSDQDMDAFVQSYLLGLDDTPDSHSWGWTQGPLESEFGGAAVQRSNTGFEISWMACPAVEVPSFGVTVVDFDVALIVDSGGFDDQASAGLSVMYGDSGNWQYVERFRWNGEIQPMPVTFEGQTVGLLGYARWVDEVETPREFRLNPGQRAAVAILGMNLFGTQIFDNIRIFNVAWEMP